MSTILYAAAMGFTTYGLTMHALNTGVTIGNSPQNSAYLAALALYAAAIAHHLIFGKRA